MPTEPQPLTVFELARRAVDVCDPAGNDALLGDFLVQFEDADEPVAGVQNIEERIALAQEGVDVELEDPSVMVASAVMLYLAFRRDEAGDDDEHVLRLAARAEWKGEPPEVVVQWLADRGVTV